MNEYALALSGGGSKGVFQIGAWQAFRELGVSFTAVAGTSIGAINAAFMVCDDYDGATQMWENLRMNQLLDLSEKQELRSDDLLSLKNAEFLIKEILHKRELNTDPMRQLLGQYIDEARVRQSKMAYGLMTAQLPSFKPLAMWIDEIEENKLMDYIMASAGLPGLKKVKIDGHRLIDGGFVENVPLSILRDRGYRRIVVVDLAENVSLKNPLIDNLELIYIHDRKDLGATLDITPRILQQNRRLGYLNTMKAFGRLQGEFYSFTGGEYRKLVKLFGAENVRGLEQAADAYEIDRFPVYEAEAFVHLIRKKRLDFEKDYMHRRESLRVDHKIRAIMGGRLKVLDMLPPMRISFLLEMTARASSNGWLQKVPMHLFGNFYLAVQALRLLDKQDNKTVAKE